MLVSSGSDLCPSANCPFSSKLTFLSRVWDWLGSPERLQVSRGGASESVGRKAFRGAFSSFGGARGTSVPVPGALTS